MPRKQATRRLYKHAYAQVFEQPWLLLPEKYTQIVELLTLRREGHEFSDDEIRERIGLFGDDEDDDTYYTIHDGVAVFPIEGTLFPRAGAFERISGATSTTQLHEQFRLAVNDPDVRAILLAIDSPGGAAVQVPEFADSIFAARSVKPIHAVSTGMMASGAYWLGSAASRAYVSTSASAGSIGVYLAHTDVSKAEEKYGRKTTLISAGRHKVDGNPYEPLTDQGRATLNERVSAIYDQFVAAVARNRGTSVETMRGPDGSGPAQGKVYLAEQAVAVGLVDGVRTLEQALAELQALVRKPAAATFAGPNRYVVPAVADTVPTPAASTLPAVSVPLLRGPHVNKQILAALFARGLVAQLDASDDVARAALTAFFAGRGQTVPDSDEKTLAGLMAAAPMQELRETIAATATSLQPLTAVSATETQRIEAAARAAERSRIDQLTARASCLGVSSEALQAAIADGSSLEAACVAWTANLGQARPPVARQDLRIEAGTSSVDTLTAAATDLIFERVAIAVNSSTARDAARIRLTDAAGQARQPHAATRDMRHMKLIDIAKVTLAAAGVRTAHMDNEDIAKTYMAMATPRNATRLELLNEPQANGPSYNTAGSIPNLMAAVASRIVEAYIPPVTTTYRTWAKMLASVENFDPATINRYSFGGELPALVENAKFPQSKMSEEANWIQVGQYGEKIGFTDIMLVKNDLSIFTDAMPAQLIKFDRTLARLCVDILVANPTLPDGTALLATGRGNLVQQTDIAFSVTNTNAAKSAMRRFKNVDGIDELGLAPSLVLVPVEQETAALQFYAPYNVVPTQDSNVNPFRGQLQVVTEPMLTNTADYYFMLDKMLVAAVVYAHQQGYESGKRESWYDPDFRTQWFSLEGRFAAAANNWRGVFKYEDSND
jgi:signal peptide peptidase SppA